MRRKLALVAVAVLAATATVAAVGFGSSSAHRDGLRVIHVVEHATTDVTTDTGGPGDTAGDLLTFHNEVFDADNQRVVGASHGDCVRIDPAAGSYECRWTLILRAGQIMVEGPFYDAEDSVLAITGGTGRFRGARGQMQLSARPGGTEFDFVYEILDH